MGGGISSLSKICVVGPPTHADADVDYTFAAVGVKNSDVDLSSNCGNMTSAVGPFAVDSGLFRSQGGEDGKVTVRIHNTNTGKIIHSTFDTVDGEAESRGDFAIDGVAGTAARVQLDFVNPAGSQTGKLLPTGFAVDIFDGIETTCVDVGNPCCFVEASALGVDGSITPDEIEHHPTLLKQLDNIRRQAGAKMGLAKTPAEVPGSIPKIGLVSPPGEAERSSIDLRIRAISVGQPHKAVPITVALSLAAAAKIPGSVVQRCTSDSPVNPDGIVLGHASGKLMVGAKFDEKGELSSGTVFRTARRLMDGNVYWK